MPKKPLSLYLPKELIENLDEEARKQSRSRNGMIELILKKFTDNKKYSHHSISVQNQ